MKERTYIAIDLKSFYASVECADRGLDPLTTFLVVADMSRTEKTICLAVTPALKAFGISGRARLFEVVQKVEEVNAQRREKTPGGRFKEAATDSKDLEASADRSLEYLVAPPRMAEYIRVSTEIYKVYLKYFAPEDICVYSIDEVFIDATAYLKTYGLSARDLAMKVILDVLSTTGITATAGIGTNLFLAKVAMDIHAKHIPPDENGVRIAELDEMSYREQLWTHRPLTDFWRVGRGYAKKLEAHGMYTMGDVARCSIGGDREYRNEDLLYKLFGVNAELLIDHAWGWEPCTMEEIKAYKPSSTSIGSGQVLQRPYAYNEAKIVAREMTELLILDLVKKKQVTDQVVLTVSYDRENLKDPYRREQYSGPVRMDHYGRAVPRHAHGTANLGGHTSSTIRIAEAATSLFERIVDKNLLVRRVNVTLTHVVGEDSIPRKEEMEQMDLFTDYEAKQAAQAEEEKRKTKERNMQIAMLSIQKKYGKNAILKGFNLEEGATTMDRNRQIGGHQA